MSSYNELLERIGTANAKCGKLNEELRVREGKRQAFSTQLETAIADYKAKYGVDITPATIDEELARVSQSVEANLKDLESLIALIESGRYDEANVLVGGTEEAPVQTEATTETTQAVPPQPTEQEQTAHVTQVHSGPVQPVQNTPVQPTIPVQPVQSAPAQSVAPSTSVQPTAPVHAEAPVQPTAPVQNTPVQQVAPSTPITPVHPSTSVVPNVPLQPTTGQPAAPSTPLSGVDSMLGGALAGFQPASSSVHPTAPPITGLGGIQPTIHQQASPTNFQDILNGSAFGVK